MKLKKYYLLISLMLIVFFSFAWSDDPRKTSLDNFPATVSSVLIDGNKISTWYMNNGSFNRDPVTGNAGFEWPKGSSNFARYASGLWMGGVVGDDTLIALAEYDEEFSPGYIDNSGNPQGKDDADYKMYKVVKNSTGSFDYVHWPFNQGAYSDSLGRPYLIGSQTLFCSFTDGYPEAHGNNAGSTAPLNAVVLKTSWCYDDSTDGPLANTVFTEYRMINRSNLPWTKFYLAIWTDDDIGSGGYDPTGCDTILNLAFSYNSDEVDPGYGIPPAVGFLFLKGPGAESASDTMKYYSPPGSNNLITKIGMKEIWMSSFNTFHNANPITGDPSNFRETYFNLQGLQKLGTPWINPITNQQTKFSYSGDPETGAGWVNNSDPQRFLASFGPFNFQPNDTQSIILAQVIAKGVNRKNSVTKLKKYSRFLKTFYKNNFKKEQPVVPAPTVTSNSPGNGKIYLSWNDTAEKVSFPNDFSGGVYRFEGYNIYQINSFSLNPSLDDTVLIKTFDIANGIKDIRDSVFINSYEGMIYGIVQRGSDNGIQRNIIIDRDTISRKNFISGTQYKFLVRAYYYDSSGGVYTLPKLNLSSNANIITVIPQNINSQVQVNYNISDTIITNQRDLAVMPVVSDPLKLISATYTCIFGNNQDTSWTLVRNVNEITDTLFRNIKLSSVPVQSAATVDGLNLINQRVRDSGLVRDRNDTYITYYLGTKNNFSYDKAWTYEPEGKEWFSAPDTNAIMTAKVIFGRQFDSRSLGMSFPRQGTFKNQRCRVFANAKQFASPDTGSSHLPIGGPLRKIRIEFGESSLAYRYVPIDTNINNTPFADMVTVPFKVFAVDELDSSAGNPRQLNTAFVDYDSSGTWNPDTSALGGYEFTFVFVTDYSPVPNNQYTSRNILLGSPTIGFPSFDVMYAWLPRVKSLNGVPQTWTNGDKLTVYPYRITRPDFVPGYPVKYSWTVNGTSFNNTANAMAEVQNIKVFPNPYYGFSELEYNDGDEKFIYFSHLPARCDIFVYTLDGVLAKKIERNTNDPNNTLEKWDLKNNSGSYVASGMYIVFMDCKELGAKVLKIAVFQNKF